MATRKLEVEIVGDSTSLERSFASSSRAAKKFESDTTGSVSKIGGAFDKIQGITAGAFVGGAAATAAVSVIKSSIDAASDLNEQITKNQQVFKDSAGGIEAWAGTTAKSIGISKEAALEATGTFGNLLSAIGIVGQPAADTSKKLVTLAADLASFNNASPEDTLDAIRSGLIGEAEPLRRYGVLLSETRVQQVAMAQTGKTTAASLTAQEKAAARLSIIFKDTTAAQGDFSRTSGGLANQQRILAANVQDLEANLGTLLLPTVAEITTALANATNAAADFAKKLQTIGQIKIPTIEIPFTTIEIPGTSGTVGDIVSAWFKHASFASVFFNSADLIKFVAGWFDEGTKGATPELANEFRRSLGDMITNALDTATSSAPQVKTPKGFGTGLTPKDLFGPIITEIPKAIQEAILDAQISGSQSQLRSALVRAQRVLEAQVTRPDLTRDQRIAAKKALKSVNDQIQSIDDEADRAAKAAATERASKASKAAAAAKKAATAAQKRQRARFDLVIQNLTTKEDAAELTARFNDNIQVENKIQAAILKQIKVEGRTAELVGNLADSRAKEAKAVKGKRLARDFKILGLGPTGEEIIPGKDSLKVQFDRITRQVGSGTIVLGGKLTKQLAGVATLLSRSSKKLAPEVASAIQGIFDAITGTMKKNQDEVFTISPATTALNSNKIVEGLGLGRHTENLIKARLSGFNAAGRALNPARGTTGAFGITLPPVHIHTSVNLDGQKVAQNTSIHQGKNRRSNPHQKRGPWSGGGWS